jgi:hypothetical protein
MDCEEDWSGPEMEEADMDIDSQVEEGPQDTAQVDPGPSGRSSEGVSALRGPSPLRDTADQRRADMHEEGTPSGNSQPSTLSARERRQIKSKATLEFREAHGVILGRIKDRWKTAVALSGASTSEHSGTLGHYLVAPNHPWARIHASHAMLVSAGLAFCKMCGKTSSTGGSLDEACYGGFKTKNASRVCRDLLKGVLPDPRSYPRWPNGDLRTVRHRPVSLVLRTVCATGVDAHIPEGDSQEAGAPASPSRMTSPTPSESGSDD